MRPPILLDFPEEFETERLHVRAPRVGDGRALNAAVIESLAELKPWMPWAREKPPTVSNSEENIRRSRAAFIERTDLRLLLFLKGSDTLVGSSGLHRIRWDVPRMEIGYWCRTSLCGRGYITEAVRGITRFAFDELGANRTEIRCAADNIRSSRVAERAGYTLEGELRNNGLSFRGKPRSTLVFSLIPKEYEAWPK